MILDEIVLHNFGVYGGRQKIGLTPPSARQPIVLFGGLNGGGKTTLLDAIHLALYGQKASLAGRGDDSYETYLSRSIHRGANPQEAAIELEFRHWSAGAANKYRVRRSWVKRDSSTRERVEIFRNDEPDPALTDAWADRVESFIPRGVSQLFLFDGEKIEQLADESTSRATLRTAIEQLLGLDLVEQLVADLQIVERRKKTASKPSKRRTEISEQEAKLEELEIQARELADRQATVRTSLGQQKKQLTKAKERLAKEGGDLFDQRTTVEGELRRCEEESALLRSELRHIAEGAAPLRLVSGVLAGLRDADERDRRRENAAQFVGDLEQRDERLLDFLEAKRAPAPMREALEEFLVSERTRVADAAAEELEVGLDVTARAQLATVNDDFLSTVNEDVEKRLNGLERATSEVRVLERKLSATPDSDKVASTKAAVDHAAEQVATAQAKLSLLEEERAKVLRERERVAARLEKLLKSDVEERFKLEDDRRIVIHAERVRDTLGRFRERLLERNARRIERLILESYSRLLRKGRLIKHVHIDPTTCDIELVGADGKPLAAHRLSAGERQLLATSILWGLAQASGRSLPAVIDTPLGRLDSEHRKHLVERYFPHASHQVLLLSTDEEIDAGHVDKLKKHIGRSYLLDFDDNASATRVREGEYFWEVPQ